MNEPTVLDYVKSIFKDWKSFFGFLRALLHHASTTDMVEAAPPEPVSAETPAPEPPNLQPAAPFPWRSVAALILALAAQRFLEPASRQVSLSIALYLVSGGLLIWAFRLGEWTLPMSEPETRRDDPMTMNSVPFFLSLALLLGGFFAFHGGKFTWINLPLWLAGTGCFVWALWIRRPRRPKSAARSDWGWIALLVAASALVVFFRVYRLNDVPGQPFSDHAEKILDVYDITQGETWVFFERNTGREAIQFYWTLLVDWIFKTGLTFKSLKIGTVLLGLLTLPFMYLLGKEVGGRRAGLLALVLTGIGYWPNVIARVGLRFPLYPLFVAPTLYYLFRGLRTQNRNDFILSGLFLGIGLHGYSPFRIVPILVVVAFALYLLHARSKVERSQAALWLVILALTSLAVFLPLLSYAIEFPEFFTYRALSRLGPLEQPLPGPWYQILFSNIGRALLLMNYDNGGIWTNSVMNRPALDVVTAALFVIGLVLLLARYARRRGWLDLFLVLAIPILQLPSSLSLAYPEENPAINRAGGSLVVIFLIAALALDGLLTALSSGLNRRGRTVAAWGAAGLLLFWSAAQNYDLVFDQYEKQYSISVWNVTDMGEVIREFGETYGTTDTVWIVPYPFWIDTRLPGIEAGIPNRDFAIYRDNLPTTLGIPGPKLFLVKAEANIPQDNDQATLDVLAQLYPQGTLTLHEAEIPGFGFWMYFVPAEN
ncbi:MAG: ArnT family glycosyltransferase [Chloroflexota bacterium]